MIDKNFFAKYQKILLFTINTKIGRWFFSVEKMGHRARGEKIVEIGPHHIGIIKEKTSRGFFVNRQYFCRPEYALKLSKFLFWFPVANFVEGFNLRPAWQLVFVALIAFFGFHLPVLFLSTTEYNPPAAGDGTVMSNWSSSGWDYVHDLATAVTMYSDQSDYWCTYSGVSGGQYNIVRGAFPFNTDSLPSGAAIASAFFKVYVPSNITDTDADGNDWMNVFQTTQADPTNLAVGDYSKIGTFEGSDRISFNGMAAGWKQFNFNATALGWIVDDSYTKLGCREGHDVLDSAVGGVVGSYATFSNSASNKPVLSVTTLEPTVNYLTNYRGRRRTPGAVSV